MKRPPESSTPLEILTRTNSELLAKRKRPAKPIQPSDAVERYYRTQLRSLVRAMARAVAEEVMPVVRDEKAAYIGDADRSVFMDRWIDRVIEALRRASARFIGQAFEAQAERVARSTVSMAEAESTSAFLKSVNQAVGVDLAPVLSQQGMAEYLDASIADNVSLIRSVSEQYFDRVQNVVLGGMRNGDHPTSIAKALQHQTGITDRRAKIIARDQVAKLNSQIVQRRQVQAGITHFRWVTANDERVTGRPGGRYANAKIKCHEIAKQDIGFGPGVYRWDRGASYAGETNLHPGRAHPQCRCTASPVFEWELPQR